MGDDPVVEHRSRQAAAPWWWGLPPLLAEVDCGVDRHRLRWTEGRLELPDHGDPDRERALGVLAGEQSGCLRRYDAWHRHTADPAVLVVAGRAPADSLYVPNPTGGAAAPGMAPQPSAFGWTAYAPMPTVYRGAMTARGPRGPGLRGQHPPDDDIDLLLLLGLGAPWTDRLTATVVAALLEGPRSNATPGNADPGNADPGNADPGNADPGTQLRAALYGRALAALRGWLGRPEMDIDLQIAAGPEAAALDLDAEPVRVTLPTRWLLDVWPRGVAVVLGRFCLAASPDPGGQELHLVTVDPDGSRSTIALRLPEPAP